jgi:hypothetical protein
MVQARVPHALVSGADPDRQGLPGRPSDYRRAFRIGISATQCFPSFPGAMTPFLFPSTLTTSNSILTIVGRQRGSLSRITGASSDASRRPRIDLSYDTKRREVLSARPRPLNLGDAIVLVAMTAAGFALTRPVITRWDARYDTSADILADMATRDLFYAPVHLHYWPTSPSPVLLSWALAIGGLRLRRPWLPLRRLLRQPEAVA